MLKQHEAIMLFFFSFPAAACFSLQGRSLLFLFLPPMMKWLSSRVKGGDVLAYFSVNRGLSPFKIRNTAETDSTAQCKVAEVSTWGRVLILLPNSQQVCTAVCPAQPIHKLSQWEVVTLWQQLAHKPHASAQFCWHQTAVLVHELEMTLDHFKLENIFFCLLSLGILLGFFFLFFYKV